MVRGDRRCSTWVRGDEVESCLGRHMLDGYGQFGHRSAQGPELAFEEGRLPVENVDGWIGGLGVDQKASAGFHEDLEDRGVLEQRCTARFGVGCGSSRVVLHRSDHAGLDTATEVCEVDVVRTVHGDHRVEEVMITGGGKDSCSILRSRCHRRDGRYEVWHHHGVAKTACGVVDNGIEHVVVTEMDVPVIWRWDLDREGHPLGAYLELASPGDAETQEEEHRGREGEPNGDFGVLFLENDLARELVEDVD